MEFFSFFYFSSKKVKYLALKVEIFGGNLLIFSLKFNMSNSIDLSFSTSIADFQTVDEFNPILTPTTRLGTQIRVLRQSILTY